VLSGAEGRHATTVRRLGPGERTDLTDGVGTMVECVITSARPGLLELAVLARHTQPAPRPRVVVVQAIPKGDRGEQAVETMTEVGVDVVVPWAAERCVAVWRGERADKGLARWRSTAAAAAKQSRRVWFPDVTPVAQTSAVTELVRRAGLALLLDPDAAQPLATLSLATLPLATLPLAASADTVSAPGAGDVVLVVGPEGGISPQESALLVEAGAVGVRLGPTVLRASSAGAAAAALIMSASGRWG
jgi:16S rRNA (uracil1498-N3)-methyltransferase